MITNLFSVFDPSTNIFNFSFNWLRTFIGLLLIPYSFWLLPSRINIIWNSILITLYKEFKTLLGPNIKIGRTFIFISIFTLILFISKQAFAILLINFLILISGIIPYESKKYIWFFLISAYNATQCDPSFQDSSRLNIIPILCFVTLLVLTQIW